MLATVYCNFHHGVMLQADIALPLRYLALLGPRTRRDQVLELAECHTVLNGGDGRSLSQLL